MIDLTTVLSSSVRLATPLALAGTGECISERAGAVNVSVDAMMLAGALAATAGSAATGSAALGLPIGMLGGLAVALVQANLSHRLRANVFVVGIALVFLMNGLAAYCYEVFEMQAEQVGVWKVPLLSKIPLIGEGFFEHRWPAYFMVAIVPLAWWILNRTRFGLELRSVGEDPQAADAVGIPVLRRRRQATCISGLMGGLGGAYLVIGEVGVFTPGMVHGRGFLVLAAVVFGGWTLKGTMIGCALFGAADALRLALPAVGYTINPQLLIAAPYLVALIAMAFFVTRNRRPAALIAHFERGLR